METIPEMELKSRRFAIYTTLAALAGIIIVALLYKKCNPVDETDKSQLAIIRALDDTITKYKNAYKETVYTMSVIKTENAKTILALQTKDSTVRRLQGLVSDYQGKLEAGSAVLTAKIETMMHDKPSVESIFFDTGEYYVPKNYKLDTTTNGYYPYNTYPTYKIHSDSTNHWLLYDITVNHDSSNVNIKVLNDFDAVIGVNKKKPFVDIIIKNPYSIVSTIRTYQVSLPKPKRWGIGPSAGMTFDGVLKPYVGIGLSYNLIRF